MRLLGLVLILLVSGPVMFSQNLVTLKIADFIQTPKVDTNVLRHDSFERTGTGGLDVPEQVMPVNLKYRNYKVPMVKVDPVSLKETPYLGRGTDFLGFVIAELEPKQLPAFWKKWSISLTSDEMEFQIDSVKLIVYHHKVGKEMTLTGNPDKDQLNILCSLKKGDFVNLDAIEYKVKGQRAQRYYWCHFYITVGPYKSEPL